MKIIKYKKLLPSAVNILINTKILPVKGNLAYEYNPLKNYRIDEKKYLYRNRFYTDKELLELNIFSNILTFESREDNRLNYYKVIETRKELNDKNYLLGSSITFQFKTGFENKHMFISLLYNNEINYVFFENDILHNGSNNRIYIEKEKDDKNQNVYYLKSTESNTYITSYDSETNTFKTDTETGIKGTEEEYITICPDDTENLSLYLKDASFNTYSSEYRHIIGKQVVNIADNEIIPYEKNSLVDFLTDELKFSLEHPVQILPLYSYDGSVNLILTDGYTKPKLINTRFSVTGKNTYQIVDRKGNNDTNIYDAGSQFDLDTSLYKQSNNIPKLYLDKVYSGGILPVGNYHFYFTYSDADGNETDFVCESGLVSIFIGNSIKSIRQGFRNENSFKGIKFSLTNIDPSYSYINVYYTKSTGDIHENMNTLAFKLTQPVFINNTEHLTLNITGYEEVKEINLEDINPVYQICETASTVASTKNILFLGNIEKETPNYTELSDLALHFGPVLDTSLEYASLDLNYNTNFSEINNTYYNPNFIYNNVGYWPEEIYRFGIVFILNDNTLTSVFNVRGINNLSEDPKYTKLPVYSKKNREYIAINENTNLLVKGDIKNLENSKGVVRLHSTANYETNRVFGIKFDVLAENKEDFLNELKKHCKGYFFVRQKRIPTVLGEALSIGVEKTGHHPCLPVSSEIISTLENCKKVNKNTSVKLTDSDTFTKVDSTLEVRCCPYINFRGSFGYVAESFLSMNRELVHNFEYHLRTIANSQVDVSAMICPDYDINYPLLNSIFTGDEFTLIKSAWQPRFKYLDANKADRHFYCNSYQKNTQNIFSTVKAKIIGVEDGTPMAGLEDSLYSALAGVPDMGYKFDLLSGDAVSTETTNLTRGIWGPFLAVNSNDKLQPCTVYTIMIPGYNASDMENYFVIRYNDKTPYFAISDRYELTDIPNDKVFYRGDCYICLFTHRMNRNFNDNTAPYNDLIVNSKTWKGKNNGEPVGDELEDDYKGFMVKDGVIRTLNFKHVNLGDINAVKLGHWVTFQLRSSFNLNIRAIDTSDLVETTRIGHGKGFYPYNPLNAGGSYKHQESLCVNKGYEKSVSERYNFELPEVPAIKNQFHNRIIYSNFATADSFKNGFRQFKGGNYLDYLMLYGELIKLLDFGEGLIAVFEHGIGYLGVNERSLLANASAGNVYLNSSRVLPDESNMQVISDSFGSLWLDSIIKTPYAIYGVDTLAKKIWKYGGKGFELISDFRVLKFLNDNITLGERELTPIIGIRNVKTHYNSFKNDVMFTFYDTLENEQERVWNLCYNENMKLFITFYSWVPSFSENIYNLYFSFNRDTSKWIAKLGLTSKGNDFSTGIVLKANRLDSAIIPDLEITTKTGIKVGNLDLSNIQYKEITNFELLHDNLLNHKKFFINYNNVNKLFELKIKVRSLDLISELYYRNSGKTEDGKTIVYYYGDDKNGLKAPDGVTYKKIETDLLLRIMRSGKYLPIYLNSDGTRKELPYPHNKEGIVYNLKVKCKYTSISGAEKEITDTITVTPQYNLLFLTTDFWKHGQSGLIDVKDKIKPTHWYGKQHPFEIEFIVAKSPTVLKIFDTMLILSNNAEPESFHYEIVGDSYSFSKDKPNMYYRQEATEALYQYNGSDIEFDLDFAETKDNLHHLHLYLTNKEGTNYQHDYKEYYEDISSQEYTKSTIFPLYYTRVNSSNEIEDYYKQKTTPHKNYDALSGAEIVYDDTSSEYKIWQHSKAVNIKGPGGRTRGNMDYLEDRWLVLINPLNILEKNEEDWENDVPPIVLNNSPIPNKSLTEDLEFSEALKESGYKDTNSQISNIKTWGDVKLTKLRDKYMRVRIRYSGKKLAIIQAVITLFRTSYA